MDAAYTLAKHIVTTRYEDIPSAAVDRCTEAGLGDILLYIGEFLVATEEKWEITEKRFKDMGFDRVYPPQTLPSVPVAGLIKELALSK